MPNITLRILSTNRLNLNSNDPKRQENNCCAELVFWWKLLFTWNKLPFSQGPVQFPPSLPPNNNLRNLPHPYASLKYKNEIGRGNVRLNEIVDVSHFNRMFVLHRKDFNAILFIQRIRSLTYRKSSMHFPIRCAIIILVRLSLIHYIFKWWIN